MILGDEERARIALEEALELQPWNVQSLQLMYVLADRTGDEALLTDMHDHLCAMGPVSAPCEPSRVGILGYPRLVVLRNE